MKFYRCRICGETYLGTEPPSRCPYCGADAEYFVSDGGFSADENLVHTTEIEKADLAKAIDIERSNARFYMAMSKLEGNEQLASGYKRLSKIEAEHCSVFCKLARIAKPSDLADPSDAVASWCEGIGESLERESIAASFYAEAANRATNERIREVFSAVAEVERDHLILDAVANQMAARE